VLAVSIDISLQLQTARTGELKFRGQIHKRSNDNLTTMFRFATNLRQLSNSQNIYDNLTTYLTTKSYDHLLDVLKQLDEP